MKLKILSIVILFMPFGSVFSQEEIKNHSDFPFLKRPYPGQNLPGLKAELFTPEIMQTSDNESLYGFFNHGTFFLFDRTPPDLEEWTPAVYKMELKDGRWIKPVMDKLISKYGVMSEQISAYGVSSLVPVAGNSTDERKAKNRRVEIVEQ